MVGWVTAELLCDQHAANAVGNEVAVSLRPKMFFRVLQPFQDQQTPIIGDRPQGNIDVIANIRHIAN